MERIVKLLVAATIATIFGVALIFLLAEFSNNGGQYWGFDGHIEPDVAANASFDSGDSRFLYVSGTRPLGKRVLAAPNHIICTFHESTDENLRKNDIEFESNIDDTSTAYRYAYSYNRRIGDLLKSKFPTSCRRQARTE